MSGKWKSVMSYVGLGPDEDYDDAPDDSFDAEPTDPPPRPQRPTGRVTARPVPSDNGPSAVSAGGFDDDGGVRVRKLSPSPTASGNEPSARPRTSVVRPIPASAAAKPLVVAPTSFNDAQSVADTFKNRQPVIVNLQGVDRDLARRLIDFASGVCYGLGGQMERVASQVYLLTPTDVEVSDEERRRLRERGLVDH